MYDISFNDGAAVSYPDRILISDVHEGENRIHGYSIYNFDVGDGYASTQNPPCKYVWPIYKLASGMTRVGSQITLSNNDFQNNNFHIDLPNGLLLEPGKLKIQIFATSSAENIDTIVDEYSAGTFSGKIIKSEVYEIFVTDSLDPIEELVGPGGISQAAKEYLTDLVDELIAEGIHIDTALSTTSVNAVENRVVTNAINGKADKANPVVTGSFSLGRAANTTVGSSSSAVGVGLTASGTASHAEGNNNVAEGNSAHVEGNGNSVQGTSAHAEGTENTVASAIAAHAEGYDNAISAGANAAHAEGSHNEASGLAAHVEGTGNSAAGDESHAEGKGTIASSNTQHVQGRYNVEDSNGDYAHILGNGTSEDARSNAHTIDWHGNAWFSGEVKMGFSLYEDEASLESVQSPIFFDSDEQAISAYADTSLSNATDAFINAISGQIQLLLGGLPLTKTTMYDLDDGVTVLGYALTYNAVPMSNLNVQWKKINDDEPITLISVVLSNKKVSLYSSVDQVDLSILATGTAIAKEELVVDSAPTDGSGNLVTSGGVYTAIQNAIGNAIGGSY